MAKSTKTSNWHDYFMNQQEILSNYFDNSLILIY